MQHINSIDGVLPLHQVWGKQSAYITASLLWCVFLLASTKESTVGKVKHYVCSDGADKWERWDLTQHYWNSQRAMLKIPLPCAYSRRNQRKTFKDHSDPYCRSQSSTHTRLKPGVMQQPDSKKHSLCVWCSSVLHSLMIFFKVGYWKRTLKAKITR